ncbi:helix-turn-helix domain-containing protein [Hymenobacter monticola]|uniref:Helix-turn-helix domain-containing protein n=1 Tax=Hymenobacter monticola TaxID=1705399 RepID=A0ABY4BB64_9BACT|nr:helix-turn-helix domain-containing protein [Hymenobacter monticola]UOE36411.1 helix-turn-helix domain-containing protein [Hymenobacter monticola]
MKATPLPIRSLSDLFRLLDLGKPQHPLIALLKHQALPPLMLATETKFVSDLYVILLKKEVRFKLKYGQNYYDFDDGLMAFMAPGQVISLENEEGNPVEGWLLAFHPDFIQPYPLGKKIKELGFFSYAVYEALHLSEAEKDMLRELMVQIEREYLSPIDQFSQDVIVSQLELLLNYANRFYNRQFLTRKKVNHDLLTRLEAALESYFSSPQLPQLGLPSVQYLAQQLHVSPNYLSDLLRTLTGKNTQQCIHEKLIEKAKDQLATTTRSISEVAYALGFEHPQSFSKLFKTKTNLSPLEFRASFN